MVGAGRNCLWVCVKREGADERRIDALWFKAKWLKGGRGGRLCVYVGRRIRDKGGMCVCVCVCVYVDMR